MMQDTESILKQTIARLSATGYDVPGEFAPCGTGRYPSVDELTRIIDTVRSIVFPEFYDSNSGRPALRDYFVGAQIESLCEKLTPEIARALKFNNVCERHLAESMASDMTYRFIECLPELKRLLLTDVQAIRKGDPAVSDYGEIVLCYPGIAALLHYRVAHALLLLDVPVLPRMLTELAHSRTGIDINPGATIGEYFAIDHGTGIVIGQTAIIGNNCTLYQGVTLGARSFVTDSDGCAVNIPRHPILQDNVTVYSNATILGRITVGRDTVVGGNVWLTHSVPPGSRILQRRAVPVSFTDGAGI